MLYFQLCEYRDRCPEWPSPWLTPNLHLEMEQNTGRGIFLDSSTTTTSFGTAREVAHLACSLRMERLLPGFNLLKDKESVLLLCLLP